MSEERTELERRKERRDYHRVESFSDGVFAIAITLLVLGIEVPDVASDDLGKAISDLVPSIVSYFIGFAVIGVYWVGHHRFFTKLRHFDAALVWVNLGYLSLVSLLPFSTALLGRNDGPLAVSIFAANVGLAALGSLAMVLVAHSQGLIVDESQAERREVRVRLLVISLVFFVSIPIAYADTSAGQFFWLSTFPLMRVAEWALGGREPRS